MPNNNKKNKKWMEFKEAKQQKGIAIQELMKPLQMEKNIAMEQLNQVLEKEANVKPKIAANEGLWAQIAKKNMEEFNARGLKIKDIEERIGELFFNNPDQKAIHDVWRRFDDRPVPQIGRQIWKDGIEYKWDGMKWNKVQKEDKLAKVVVQPKKDGLIDIQNEWLKEWGEVAVRQGHLRNAQARQVVEPVFFGGDNINPAWAGGGGGGNQNVIIGADPIGGAVQYHYNPYKPVAKAEPVNPDEVKISIDRTCNYMAFKEINKKYGKEVVTYKNGKVVMADELQDEFLELYDNHYDSLTEATEKA